MLPDTRVADFIPDSQLRAWFQTADLSIHLFSDRADPIAARQFDLARNFDKPIVAATVAPLDTAGFPPQVGLPVLLTSSGSPQLVHDWKQRVMDQVQTRLHPPPPAEESGEPATVYLICHPSDFLLANELRETLLDHNIEVLLPTTRFREPERARRDHESKLARSRGALLYWGHASEDWFLVRATYLAPPFDGKPAPSGGGLVIRESDGVSSEALLPFIAKLNRGSAGALV